MVDETKIAAAVVKALNESRTIDPETHHEHHEFITVMKRREAKRAQMYEAVTLHLAKFGSVALMSAVFVAIWFYLTYSGKG